MLLIAAIIVWSTMTACAGAGMIVDHHERGVTLVSTEDGSASSVDGFSAQPGSSVVPWENGWLDHWRDDHVPCVELVVWPSASMLESGKQLISLRSSSCL